jgi:hypothetical protein
MQKQFLISCLFAAAFISFLIWFGVWGFIDPLLSSYFIAIVTIAGIVIGYSVINIIFDDKERPTRDVTVATNHRNCGQIPVKFVTWRHRNGCPVSVTWHYQKMSKTTMDTASQGEPARAVSSAYDPDRLFLDKLLEDDENVHYVPNG